MLSEEWQNLPYNFRWMDAFQQIINEGDIEIILLLFACENLE